MDLCNKTCLTLWPAVCIYTSLAVSASGTQSSAINPQRSQGSGTPWKFPSHAELLKKKQPDYLYLYGWPLNLLGNSMTAP